MRSKRLPALEVERLAEGYFQSRPQGLLQLDVEPNCTHISSEGTRCTAVPVYKVTRRVPNRVTKRRDVEVLFVCEPHAVPFIEQAREGVS